LPIVLGCVAGGQHVARVSRVCTHCGSVAVADEMHVTFECTDTNTINSFFAQQDHMQDFKFVLSCLDLCVFRYVIRFVGWLKHCNLFGYC